MAQKGLFANDDDEEEEEEEDDLPQSSHIFTFFTKVPSDDRQYSILYSIARILGK